MIFDDTCRQSGVLVLQAPDVLPDTANAWHPVTPTKGCGWPIRLAKPFPAGSSSKGARAVPDIGLGHGWRLLGFSLPSLLPGLYPRGVKGQVRDRAHTVGQRLHQPPQLSGSKVQSASRQRPDGCAAPVACRCHGVGQPIVHRVFHSVQLMLVHLEDLLCSGRQGYGWRDCWRWIPRKHLHWPQHSIKVGLAPPPAWCKCHRPSAGCMTGAHSSKFDQ